MKTKLLITIIAVSLFSPTIAIKRWGKITKYYEYDRLKIVQQSSNRCKITGKIKNNTKEFRHGYLFNMYAFDIHNQLHWATTINVSSIEKGGETEFTKHLYDCKENNPYRLEFKQL